MDRKAKYWSGFFACLVSVFLGCDTHQEFAEAAQARSIVSGALQDFPLTPDPIPPVVPCEAPIDSPNLPNNVPDWTHTAGELSGAVSVGSGGEAVFTMALDVLPGRQGMQPNLSLTYSSNRGDGLLGPGFALNGLESIERCSQSFINGDVIHAVTYSEEDRLCYNGRPLIQIGLGGYWDAGQDYRVQNTPQTIVTSLDEDDDIAGFRVESQDGWIRLFGTDVESRAGGFGVETQFVQTWGIRSAEDLSGNQMLFSYYNDHKTVELDSVVTPVFMRPRAIYYTAHANGLAPERRIEFGYEALLQHVDAGTDRYRGGNRFPRTHLLTTVKMHGPGDELVHQYRLAYDPDGEFPMLNNLALTSIEKCDANDRCLKPTDFTWDPSSWWFETEFTGVSASTAQALQVMDFNGDGFDDLVYLRSLPHDKWEALLGGENGLSGPVTIEAPEFFAAVVPTGPYNVVDYNRDGRADLMFLGRAHGSQESQWQVLEAQGAAEFKLRTLFQIPIAETSWVAGHPETGFSRLIDLDGDGRPSIVFPSYDGNQLSAFHIRELLPMGGFLADAEVVDVSAENFANGWQTRVSECELFGLHCVKERYNFTRPYSFRDTDGDGAAELVACTFAGQCRFVSLDQRGSYDLRLAHDDDEKLTKQRSLDLNGDGLSEFLKQTDEGSFVLRLNKGGGYFGDFYDPLVNHLLPELHDDVAEKEAFHIADFTNDGRDDVMVAGVDSWQLLESVGDAFRPIQVFIPYKPIYSDKFVTMDANGDGTLDIVHVADDSNKWRIEYNRGTKGHRLVGIHFGLGAETQIEYSHLSDSEVYTRTVASSFDTMQEGLAQLVVKGISRSAGDGEFVRTRMHYEDALADPVIGQSLGFRKRTEHNLDARTLKTTEYGLSDVYDKDLGIYPYVGYPTEVSRYVEAVEAGGFLLHTRSKPVYELIERFWFRAYSVRQVGRVSEERDPWNGAELLASITETWDYLPSDFPELYTKVTTDSEGNILKEQWINYEYEDPHVSWFGKATRIVDRVQINKEPGTLVSNEVVTTYSPSHLSPSAIHRNPTSPDGSLLLKYTYDIYGNVVSTEEVDGSGASRWETVEFDAEGLLPVCWTNALGHKSAAAWDRGLGLETASVDPNGLVSYAAYDSFGRVVWTKTPAGAESLTLREIGDDAALIESNYINGTKVSETAYSEFGQVTRSSSRQFAGAWTHSNLAYDRLGRSVRRSLPYRDGDFIEHVSLEYDSFGRMTKEVRPDGSETRVVYDGLKETTINASFHAFESVKDALGNVVQTTDPYGEVTSFSYNALGELMTAVDAHGNVTSLVFDSLGRRTKLTDPDSGATVFFYNGFGDITEAKHVDSGQSKKFAYDELGRTTQVLTQDGSRDFFFDTAVNGLGKIGSSRGDTGILTEYEYDAFGRISEHRLKLGLEVLRLNYEYDANGRLVELAYPEQDGRDRLRAARSYDPYGSLLDVRLVNPQGVPVRTLWSLGEVDAMGHATRVMLDGQFHTTRSFDPRTGNIETILTEHSIAGTVYQDLEYAWDVMSNLSDRHDRTQGVREVFEYDKLDRLSGSTVWRSGLLSESSSYAYDEIGNLIFKSGNGAYAYGGGGTAGPHAVTSAGGRAFTYDSRGHQVDNGHRTLDFDAFGLVKKAALDGVPGETRFEYSSDGTRVLKRVVDGNDQFVTETLNLEDLYRRDLLPGSSRHTFYVPGPSGMTVAAVVQERDDLGFWLEDEFNQYHYDHLGSLSLVTQGDGQVVEELSYQPFGERRNPDFTSADVPIQSVVARFGFSNQEHDDELGIINMQGRLYDPSLARFLSPDPFVQFPLAGQSLNRYSYVLNNPLKYVDPTGYNSESTPSSNASPVVAEEASSHSSDTTPTQQAEVEPFSLARGGMYDAKLITPLELPQLEFDYLLAIGGSIDGVPVRYMTGDWQLHREQSAAEQVASFGAAFGDSLTLGLSEWIRNKLGVGDLVNKDSAAGDWGTIASVVVPMPSAKGGRLLKYGILSRGPKRKSIHPAQMRGRGQICAGPKCKKCFTAGTQVLMADGTTRAIENIEVMDLVMADEPRDQVAPAPHRVIDVLRNRTHRIVNVFVGSLDTEWIGTIESTSEHPFWTDNAGWVFAIDLQPDDVLLTSDGSLKVVLDTIEESRQAPTFNLTVAGTHTFYVLAGDSPILVHNAPRNGGRRSGRTRRREKTTPQGDLHAFDRDAARNSKGQNQRPPRNVDKFKSVAGATDQLDGISHAQRRKTVGVIIDTTGKSEAAVNRELKQAALDASDVCN